MEVSLASDKAMDISKRQIQKNSALCFRTGDRAVLGQLYDVLGVMSISHCSSDCSLL